MTSENLVNARLRAKSNYDILPTMTEIKKYEFLDPPITDSQKLGTRTCPSFTRVEQAALRDFWETKCCPQRGCLVKVQFEPSIGRLIIKGHCPIE